MTASQGRSKLGLHSHGSTSRAEHSSLRRRFTQNQEDCTFTVLALLPTAADNILEALPVESITHELQRQRQARLGQNVASPSELSSNASGEDGRSLSSFQTESFVHASQVTGSSAGSSESPRPQKTKAQLWNELKISSITRSLTLVYTLALLAIFTRIQLNLLGRRSYVLSVVTLASQKSRGPTISLETEEEMEAHCTLGNDFQTNRSFLAFSWWLLHRGWQEVMKRVETAVEEIFGPINPREEISFEKLTELMLDIRKRIEGASEEERRSQKWLSFVLPPPNQEEFVLHESGVLDSPSQSSDAPPGRSHHASESSINEPQPIPISPSPKPNSITTSLRRLLDESSDIIDSPRFTYVLTRLLDTLFSELTDTAIRTQAFRLPDPALAPSLTTATSELQSGEPEAAKVKLANVLAVVTRQAHAIGNGIPNVYVQAMEQVKELESLAVVIFSSDFDLEEITKAQEAAAQSKARNNTEQVQEREHQESDAVGSTWGMFENIWQRVST